MEWIIDGRWTILRGKNFSSCIYEWHKGDGVVQYAVHGSNRVGDELEYMGASFARIVHTVGRCRVFDGILGAQANAVSRLRWHEARAKTTTVVGENDGRK